MNKKLGNEHPKYKFGCSSIKLTSKTNNHYWFRTCDMDDNANVWKAGSEVISFNKGYNFNFSNNENIESKYSILGVSFGKPYERLLDGINEKGLVGGLLYYVEGTSIDKEMLKKDKSDKIGVEGMEIVTYFLSNCGNVEDVKKLASEIVVTNVIHNQYSLQATMHYIFLDNNGGSVALEADEGGKFTLHNNTIGVFTNSPSYCEHISNLSWYIGSSLELQVGRRRDLKQISPPIYKFELDGIEIKGDDTKKTYLRSNVFPGSYTSTDRFIRLATLKHLSNCGRDFCDDEMLLKGSEIISSVIVPRHGGYLYYNYLLENEKGEVTFKDHSLDGRIIYGGGDDYTQYVIMYDLSGKSLYIKSDKSLIYDRIDLDDIKKGLTIYKINFNSNKGIIHHK